MHSPARSTFTLRTYFLDPLKYQTRCSPNTAITEASLHKAMKV